MGGISLIAIVVAIELRNRFRNVTTVLEYLLLMMRVMCIKMSDSFICILVTNMKNNRKGEANRREIVIKGWIIIYLKSFQSQTRNLAWLKNTELFVIR